MIIGNPITLGGGGTTVGVSYNADGTQNLTILDKGKIVEVPPTLLWINDSPTSEFAAQTVSVDGADYTGYLVELRQSTTVSDTAVAYLPFTDTMIGLAVCAQFAYADTTYPTDVGRQVNAATTSSIEFGTGYAQASGSISRGNTYGIPTRIWGVKYAV